MSNGNRRLLEHDGRDKRALAGKHPAITQMCRLPDPLDAHGWENGVCHIDRIPDAAAAVADTFWCLWTPPECPGSAPRFALLAAQGRDT